MKKIKMTYDNFDKLEEALENLETQAVPAYPTQWEVDHYIRPNFEKYLKYIMWLLSQDVELTEEELKIQKELRNMLYQNLELYDREEKL